MAPSILIIGATGNTGRSVTETLPEPLKATKSLSDHRVIGLTRSLDSPVSKQLAKVPGVEMVEQNWVEITADWLREHEVVRAFIASHNAPNQFAEESTFHLAALKAGVNNLQWTSLQPNVFSPLYLFTAAEFIRQYRKTGTQDTLKLMAAKDAPVGIVDPDEVGRFAALLLSQDDTTVHNKAKYVLNGLEDVTGAQIVNMVEQHTGTKVQHVSYEDMSFVDSFLDAGSLGAQQSTNVILSIKYAPVTAWEGKCMAATTSKEVLELAAPKRTPVDVLRDLLEV
ncbi:hypothetical protein ANOM_008091 [Aspergillus nomiae NRRL 13137]|uniref:NmrA-like domain-containing protein n=1 Tax=Aspergillus nomiae NRRL (strain ATCC 15546 / NRRL 13137 / CBS 260.88 / M93) TaxID=1509407 RepID=A0A0L1J098_ASPN3|nr:uncharacterized protein ANOM_008091 [Aspergillus nomiae NRRL 13137]KNG85194.1 hypothetical protein ANOM_008091 [Aspergillus nomiae NRRL 13137]